MKWSDSVPCLGKLSDPSEANRRWEGQVADFQLFASCEELLGIDGDPIEFEWNIVPGLTSLQILQRIQNDLQETLSLKNLEGRIVFMPMFIDMEGQDKETKRILFQIEKKSQDVRDKILAGTLDVPRPWRRKELVWKLQLKT